MYEYEVILGAYLQGGHHWDLVVSIILCFQMFRPFIVLVFYLSNCLQDFFEGNKSLKDFEIATIFELVL